MDALSEVVAVEKANEILSTMLHQIDVVSGKAALIPMSTDYSDLNGYLEGLLKEIGEQELKRSYDFERETTEFYSALKSCATDRMLSPTQCGALADRLATQEQKTDERYGHLGKDGKKVVNKGSFLQFLYQRDGSISYLGVKIEHQTFLDEEDFKRRSGLPDASKIYKACRVSFKDGLPDDVAAFDTNSRPSVYWWSSFLELKVIRDDRQNTEKASDAVVTAVASIRKKYPADHTILRNAVIAAFKQDGVMHYTKFIKDVFEDYAPDDPELKKAMPTLIKRLKGLPEKEGFDTQFPLVPSAVNFRQTRIKLTPQITLSYDADLNNISDKIWSEETQDGKKLVVINSPDAFEKFVRKERI